jgi:hypothetical protein
MLSLPLPCLTVIRAYAFFCFYILGAAEFMHFYNFTICDKLKLVLCASIGVNSWIAQVQEGLGLLVKLSSGAKSTLVAPCDEVK